MGLLLNRWIFFKIYIYDCNMVILVLISTDWVYLGHRECHYNGCVKFNCNVRGVIVHQYIVSGEKSDLYFINLNTTKLNHNM